MALRKGLLAAISSVVIFGALGCAPHYVAPPPPPPPPAAPPIVQFAERQGFELGRADGARTAEAGAPPEPRRTPAYHDTPGYQPGMGPFDVYQNAFRNAYLRGYEKGYHRG
jgi:hypothetical protein